MGKSHETWTSIYININHGIFQKAGYPHLENPCLTGRREIPENEKDHHKKPHNVPFVALGTALLWFGWFGFNPGAWSFHGNSSCFIMHQNLSSENFWLVVWNMNFIFPFSWEFHIPNWWTPSFFRGVAQSPTRYNMYIYYMISYSKSDITDISLEYILVSMIFCGNKVAHWKVAHQGFNK